MAVQGLKAAGLSPSDPTGNGYSSSQSPMQQDSPSAPSATIPSIPGSDFISAYAALKQAENISSVTRLNEIESNYRARKLEGEIAALNQEIDQKRETFPLIVSNLKQDIESKIASKMLTENQGLEALQRIENLKASLDGIKIDNRYNEKTLLTRISKESAELAGLLKDNRIKEAEAKLADLGIVLRPSTLLWHVLINLLLSTSHNIISIADKTIYNRLKQCTSSTWQRTNHLANSTSKLRYNLVSLTVENSR